MTGEIIKILGKSLEREKKGIVIMMELPTESYFHVNLTSIKYLTSKGFEGIYISFQRPFKNVSSLFSRQGIDMNKILFIDVASALSGEREEENPRCIHISQTIDIDELVRAIYTSLPRLKSRKRFIFIDSLTTITLYKPLSEIMRFSEFLIRTVKKSEKENTILIFNVVKDLAQKKFIRDIALRVDEVISVAK